MEFEIENDNIKTILLPLKGTPYDLEICKMALNLNKSLTNSKAIIHALHIMEIPFKYPEDAEIPEKITLSESILSKIDTLAKEYKTEIKTHLIQSRRAGYAIINLENELKADLIMLSSLFKENHINEQIGTTINYVLRFSKSTIILLRPGIKN